MHLKILSCLVTLAILNSCGSNKSTDPTTADSTIGENKLSRLDTLKNIEICTEFLPYPDSKFSDLYKIDSQKVEVFAIDGKKQYDTVFTLHDKPVKMYLQSLKDYTWNTNSLRVKFLDGDSGGQLIQQVISAAKEWEKYCAIRFSFGDFSDPHITVSFKGSGYKSYIGKDSYRRTPSLTLAGLNLNMAPEKFNRIVLHEFGHALGFVHEHQVPEAEIPWDYNVIYDYYLKNEKWDRQTVYEQVLRKYAFGETNGTSLDTNSIMMYAIPKEVTQNQKYHVEWKNQLSKLDKELASKRYH